MKIKIKAELGRLNLEGTATSLEELDAIVKDIKEESARLKELGIIS